MELIHMTAAYSNAVLVAVLPYISDFSARLHLPIPQPVTTNQVRRYVPSPYKDFVMAGVWLTNDYWFEVGTRGFVEGYRCPTNWFAEQELTPESCLKYVGRDNMTTNEAIELVRESLVKVGFHPDVTHSQDRPVVEGPFDSSKIGHIPYCRVIWEFPKGEENPHNLNHIKVDVNMESKTIAEMSVILSYTNKMDAVPVKIDMVPELESDFRKRMNPNKMFINTNAPKHLPSSD